MANVNRSTLAKLFGCSERDVDEVVKRDAAARRELTRRGFLAAALALAASPVVPVPEVDWSQQITYSIPEIGTETIFFNDPNFWLASAGKFTVKFFKVWHHQLTAYEIGMEWEKVGSL